MSICLPCSVDNEVFLFFFFSLTIVLIWLFTNVLLCLQMFYLVLLAVTASVHSVMYGPGSPVSGDPRLAGVSTNPFANFMKLPISMKSCRPASQYSVDAIFDRSFLCPKNIDMPRNWPTTPKGRFFVPDQQYPTYQQ